MTPDAEKRARAAAAAEQRLQLANPGYSQPRQHQPITPGGSTAKEEKLGAAEAPPAGFCRLRIDQGAAELEIKGAADQGSSSDIKGAAKLEIKVESTVQPERPGPGPLWCPASATGRSFDLLTPTTCSSSSGAPVAFVESSQQPVESSPAMESSQAVESSHAVKSSQQLREVLEDLKTTRAQLQLVEAQLEHERQAAREAREASIGRRLLALEAQISRTAALMKQVKRKELSRTLTLELRRSSLAADLLHEAATKLQPAHMLFANIQVEFVNEQGRDEGALRINAFAAFHERLYTQPCTARFFQRTRSGSFVPVADAIAKDLPPLMLPFCEGDEKELLSSCGDGGDGGGGDGDGSHGSAAPRRWSVGQQVEAELAELASRLACICSPRRPSPFPTGGGQVHGAEAWQFARQVVPRAHRLGARCRGPMQCEV